MKVQDKVQQKRVLKSSQSGGCALYNSIKPSLKTTDAAAALTLRIPQ